MSYNRPTPVAGSRTPVHPPRPWAPGETTRRAEQPMPLARRYELSWLDPHGMLNHRTEIAHALPVFEDAFSAFAHGVLIQTEAGPVPVEDLEPGAMLACPNGRLARLVWKGAINLVPGAPSQDGSPVTLTRVAADTYGPGKPARDVLFGPGARRLSRGALVRRETGSEAALTRLAEAVDGAQVIAVHPVQPIRVYHLMTDTHATILAGGLEVGTYHPCRDDLLSLNHDQRRVFLSLFPHLDGGDFGRALWPRADGVAA